MPRLSLIFIGTPDFALPSLEALKKDGRFDIMAIITQPDKKAGRKQVLTPPPVKEFALKNNIPVWQPEKIREFVLPEAPIDLIVVAAYAQILPERILNLPKLGCINVHGSLLPKYRGASCVQAAILDGEEKSGVTIMKMDKGLDTGPILARAEIRIADDETGGSLYEKLARLGGEILPGTLIAYAGGEIRPAPQDDSKASYAGILKKEDGRIDWSKPAEEIERFVRAMRPWPGAFTSLKIKDKISKLKILAVGYSPIPENKRKSGELFLHNGKLAVRCGRDALVIERLQPEGKKEMAAEEFLRGYREISGLFE